MQMEDTYSDFCSHGPASRCTRLWRPVPVWPWIVTTRLQIV